MPEREITDRERELRTQNFITHGLRFLAVAYSYNQSLLVYMPERERDKWWGCKEGRKKTNQAPAALDLSTIAIQRTTRDKAEWKQAISNFIKLSSASLGTPRCRQHESQRKAIIPNGQFRAPCPQVLHPYPPPFPPPPPRSSPPNPPPHPHSDSNTEQSQSTKNPNNNNKKGEGGCSQGDSTCADVIPRHAMRRWRGVWNGRLFLTRVLGREQSHTRTAVHLRPLAALLRHGVRLFRVYIIIVINYRCFLKRFTFPAFWLGSGGGGGGNRRSDGGCWGGGGDGGVVSDVVSSRTLTSCQPHRSNRTFKIPCSPFKTRVA